MDLLRDELLARSLLAFETIEVEAREARERREASSHREALSEDGAERRRQREVAVGVTHHRRYERGVLRLRDASWRCAHASRYKDGRVRGSRDLPKIQEIVIHEAVARRVVAGGRQAWARDASVARTLSRHCSILDRVSAPETRSISIRGSTLEVRAVTLHVAQGPDAGRRARRSPAMFVVGVGDSADFRLTDPSVSREHLRIALALAAFDFATKAARTEPSSRCAHPRHDAHERRCRDVGSTTLAITLATDSIDLPLQREQALRRRDRNDGAHASLVRAARARGRVRFTVLLEGESGVARTSSRTRSTARARGAKGRSSSRTAARSRPSHRRGALRARTRAFTGADRTRKGVIEEPTAERCSLDEVGELPLEMQPKLLRMMEQREIRPVGSNTARAVECASSRHESPARRGRAHGRVPERPLLPARRGRVAVPRFVNAATTSCDRARDCCARSRKIQGGLPRRLRVDARRLLVAGNVRELRNVVERHAVLGSDAKASSRGRHGLALDHGGPRQPHVPRGAKARDGSLRRALPHEGAGTCRREHGARAELSGVARTSFIG